MSSYLLVFTQTLHLVQLLSNASHTIKFQSFKIIIMNQSMYVAELNRVLEQSNTELLLKKFTEVVNTKGIVTPNDIPDLLHEIPNTFDLMQDNLARVFKLKYKEQ